MGLVGCATEQWKAAEAQCHMAAMDIFPVALEQRMVLDMQPMPMFNRCLQVPYKDKDGKDLVRNECSMLAPMVFPRWETIDLNQRMRNDHVRRCAQQSCFLNHGNTDCKPPSTEAIPKP
jgi:hypothetical protein